MSNFKAKHLNASNADFEGNNGIGRYVFLPGSAGRAKEIAEHFVDVKIKEHPRAHHVYLGKLKIADTFIDVAAVSSGMGCPSVEIILHELFHLGAKRFLRVGTAGSLQPGTVRIGDFVNAQASVRDEATTLDYVPLSFPAIASFEFTHAVASSAKQLQLTERIHTGLVHCKSSFYAKEFGVGPQGGTHKTYNKMLSQSGVLATEMETATLFIQSQLFDYQLKQQGSGAKFRVYAGALLAIVGDVDDNQANTLEYEAIIQDLITLGMESIKQLACDDGIVTRERYSYK